MPKLNGSVIQGLDSMVGLSGLDPDTTMDPYTLAAASRAPVGDTFTLAAVHRSGPSEGFIPSLN